MLRNHNIRRSAVKALGSRRCPARTQPSSLVILGNEDADREEGGASGTPAARWRAAVAASSITSGTPDQPQLYTARRAETQGSGR
jgi:hypothetical protein